MRKATFITSVHNGERFVEETIKSVLNQSEPDFWYVIRLDACTDRSEEIVRKYASADDRIIVLKNKNNYVTDEGIPARKRAYWPKYDSEYISIVDHDDILHPDFLSTLYPLGKAFHADQVIAGYMLFNDATGKELRRRVPSAFQIERLEDIGPYFSDLYSSISPRWGKLYSAELYDRYYEEICTYPKGVYLMLDAWQNFSLLEHCQRIIGVDQVLYYYRANQISQYAPEFPSETRISEAAFFFNAQRSFLQKINCDTQDNIMRLYHAHRARILDLVDIVKRSCKMSAKDKTDYLQKILQDQQLATYRDFALEKIQPRIQGCMEEIVQNEEENIELWASYLFRTDYVRVHGIHSPKNMVTFLSALLCRDNVLSYGIEMLSQALWAQIPALDQAKIIKNIQYLDKSQYLAPNILDLEQRSCELEALLISSVEREKWKRSSELLQELESYTLTSEAGNLCRLSILLRQGEMEEAKRFSFVAQALHPESQAIQKACGQLQ